LPTIKENKMEWGNPQTWEKYREGDSWSSRWGNPDNQWVWTIFPRIHRYVPTGRILEIAPGFGRWTAYLKELCKELLVVDLNELCIQRCKERFSFSKNIAYYVNDGKTLDMIPDKSIDFVFSFDSLVHAEDDVIEAYLTQLANKLKPDGVGCLHHSNMESYKLFFQRRSLGISKILGFEPHWRSRSMTAKKFEQLAEKAGMQTISQEKINWGNRHYFLIDCISVFTPKNSKWARPNSTLANGHFMNEIHYARKLSALYGQP
jgi:ubiquinone/menaquinone biosynthesis C-methylase UbiE